MKLNKKHIGQLFDVQGSDGSWWYQLVDISRKEYLFLSGNYRWEIESKSRYDWRPFSPQPYKIKKRDVTFGWKHGRRDK